jgi:hypothetical protein
MIQIFFDSMVTFEITHEWNTSQYHMLQQLHLELQDMSGSLFWPLSESTYEYCALFHKLDCANSCLSFNQKTSLQHYARNRCELATAHPSVRHVLNRLNS